MELCSGQGKLVELQLLHSERRLILHGFLDSFLALDCGTCHEYRYYDVHLRPVKLHWVGVLHLFVVFINELIINNAVERPMPPATKNVFVCIV